MGRKIIICLSLFIFHFSFAQNGTWFWGIHNIGEVYIESVAADSKGDCYVAGLFPNDTIQWGSDILRNSTITNYPYSSNFDAYIAKLDHNGNVLWAKQTIEKNSNPNIENASPENLCTSNSGPVYLSGNFIDTIYVGGYMLITPEYTTGSQSTYLAKYDVNGNPLWAKQAICINDSSFINEDCAACDNHGNIYVTGIFGDSIRFGGNIISTPFQALQSMFLVKYDSNGNVVWARQSIGTSQGLGVTNDQYGNTFVTGGFEDSVSFGSNRLGAVSVDFFIAKYDPNGNVLWAKQANTTSHFCNAGGVSVAVDLNENVYITGQFSDTVIFGHDTFSSFSSTLGSFFLVKYDPTGNLLWAKQATALDGNHWSSWSISVDNSKHLYLSANGGAGEGALNKIGFAGDTLIMQDTASEDAPSIIFKLDSNGNSICSSIIPVGGGNNGPTASACDSSGNYVYIAGAAIGVAVFGEDTINSYKVHGGFPYKINNVAFVARWQECDSDVLYAGVQNIKPVGQVVLYPNPNNGSFTLALQNVNAPAQVEIYNMLGESIYKTKLNPTNTILSLIGQPSGVYFYRVITQDGGLVGSGKLVIEK